MENIQSTVTHYCNVTLWESWEPGNAERKWGTLLSKATQLVAVLLTAWIQSNQLLKARNFLKKEKKKKKKTKGKSYVILYNASKSRGLDLMSSPGVLELLQIRPPAFSRRRDYSVFQLIPVLSFGQPQQHPLTWLWSPKALFRTVSTPSAALVRRGYSWHTLQKCSQSIQPSFFMEQMSKAQTSCEFIKWSS